MRIFRNKKFDLWVLLAVICISTFWFYASSIKHEHFIFGRDEKTFNSDAPKKIIVTFRNDDLQASSDIEHESYLLSIFSKYGIKQTFAFIPKTTSNEEYLKDPQGRGHKMINALKEWLKDGKIEIALHGYTHIPSEKTIGEFGDLPLQEQIVRIRDGKKIIRQILGIDAKIFAPPFNQADRQTVTACAESGISIFSGYWGIDSPRLIQVNTNAELFSTQYAKTYLAESRIPVAEELIDLARNTPGIKFCNIFYHSATDFDSQEKISYLDNFLNKLTNDPGIEISTIGALPDKYPAAFQAYTHANICTATFLQDISYVKPYRFLSNLLSSIFLNTNDLINGKMKVLQNYWSGNYEKACTLAIKLSKRLYNIMLFGRMAVFFITLASFMIYYLIKDKLSGLFEIKPLLGSIWNLVFIIMLTPLILSLLINVFESFHNERITEINALTLIYLIGLASSQVIIQLRNSRN